MKRQKLTPIQRHLIEAHGYNNDTARLYNNAELKSAHRRYHDDETGSYLGHTHAEIEQGEDL
jgi:hypothetical protein